MITILKKRILAARKEIPADLVLKNGRIINVFSGKIQKKDIAVFEDVIVGLGFNYKGKIEVDLGEKWVVPGLIDGHLHIESSMLCPSELAAALLIHGTTTIISDPHEIANVMGIEGIKFMLKESDQIPFDVYFLAPSCVPATTLETSGATLKASDLMLLKHEPRILGLAEMMNYPGVLMGNHDVLEKIELFQDKVLDGHCPSLTGNDLQAYISTGIRSDHEITSYPEGLEKLENGMIIMIREGTSAKNLEALLPLVDEKNARRFCLVSDDLHCQDIQQKGHLDSVAKKAIDLGLDPITAIQMVTLNPAEYFGLKDRGGIAPGYRADLVILKDLETFQVSSVYKDGRMVADHRGLHDFPKKKGAFFSSKPHPLNIAPLSLDSFRIPNAQGKARVIQLIPGQITTRMLLQKVKSMNGIVISDVESDILKLCVVERHKASGRIGLGLVKGFGLKAGAIASSIAHDSHNIIAVGVLDDDILCAIEAVSNMGGGLVAVHDTQVIAKVPLGIAGLMSTLPIDSFLEQLRQVDAAAADLGCNLAKPYMDLSFLALPVIPELRLTDKGLVDVNQFAFTPLFIKQA